ncbi:MAG: hypothetical protein M3N53_02045 [Actinomycetota bacterium]|nr:hypothetical protein [Actinomycetota bacterium]
MSTTGSRSRFAATAAFVLVVLLPGLAQAQLPSAAGGLGNNLEWVKTVVIDTVPTQVPGYASVFGDTLFLSDGVQGVNIYDVSDPLNPLLVAELNTPGPSFYPDQVGAYITYGRYTTNGKILLQAGYDEDSRYFPGEEATMTLYVFDVSDPANPQRLGKLTRKLAHHYGGAFCILDCKWAYDRGGGIIDLRDPSAPKPAGNWLKGLRFHSAHFTKGPAATDIVEIARGVVATGTVPMYVLDVSRPTKPRVLARSDGSPSTRGSIAWPDFAAGGPLLTSNVGGIGAGREHCGVAAEDEGSSKDSLFATWDGSHWRKSNLLTRVDQYRPRNGTYTDGDPAVSGSNIAYGGGCAVGYFHVRRSRGGTYLAAVATRGHGMKLLEVDRAGRISQHGWFLPHGGSTLNSVWVTDRVIYTIDSHRGIDILRYTGDL